MHPLVSIMIPTYNQPEYIQQTIESALSQDYPNLEVIVSDDSTNVETEQIVERFRKDDRFSYFKNEQNIGRVANYRKLLFELAKGEWVLMLDGDDFLIDKKYVSNAIDVIDSNPAVVLVGAGIKVLQHSTNEAISRPLVNENRIFKGTKVFQDLMPLPNHQTDIYPRKLACELDFYRDGSMASDSESLFRLCLNGDVAYLSSIASVWRIHQQNTTYTLNIMKQIREIAFIDKVFEYSKNYIEARTAKKWRRYMYNLMAMHIFYLKSIRLKEMLLLYKRVNRYLSLTQKMFFLKKISKVLQMSGTNKIKSLTKKSYA